MLRSSWELRLQHGDLELARQAADGDRGAFHAIVDRHAQHLFRVARSLSRSADDAEDVVQDAFLAAYRGIGKFNGRSSLKTWLSQIVMKRAVSAWRKNKRHRVAVSLEEMHETPSRNGNSGGGAAVAAVDQRLDLAAVLPALAPEYREIFLLREVQGLSYAEIADTLGIPPGTVDSRLHRARAELRRKLRSYRKR